MGKSFQFHKIKRVLWMVVMVAQHNGCVLLRLNIHLWPFLSMAQDCGSPCKKIIIIGVKMVNFYVIVFYHNKKKISFEVDERRGINALPICRGKSLT